MKSVTQCATVLSMLAVMAMPALAQSDPQAPPVAPEGRQATSRAAECDRLAAAPYDQQATAPGVSWSALVPELAIPACLAAIDVSPDEPRLQYQLGRSYDRAGQFDDAMQWYQKAIEAGYSVALKALGQHYQYGWGVDMDYAKAISWYEAAVAAGDIGSLSDLAFLYETGKGMPIDYAGARSLYGRAAARGDAWAMYRLGWLSYYGDGGPQDSAAALDWWTRAANAGSPAAMLHLVTASRAWTGTADFVEADAAKAGAWLDKLIAADPPDYAYPIAVNLDRLDRQAESLAWFRKAADKGDERALDMLVPRLDAAGLRAEATAWLKRFAEAGDAETISQLAMRLDSGGERAEAKVWYTKAAEIGDISAILQLADLLDADGRASEATVWFTRAANAGDLTAMAILAERYMAGTGVARDLGAATEWAKKATSDLPAFLAGDRRAWEAAGALYNDGNGIADVRAAAIVSYHESARQLQRCYLQDRWQPIAELKTLDSLVAAANAGRVAAMICLGHIYSGKNKAIAPRNDHEAIKWFESAYAAGDPHAAYYLGLIHIDGDRETPDVVLWLKQLFGEGIVIRPDPVVSRQWFLKAAEAGDYDAMLWLGNYGTPDEKFPWMLKTLDYRPAMTGSGISSLYLAEGWGGMSRAVAAAYLCGNGVTADPVRAAAYLVQAYQRGSWEAGANLRSIGPLQNGEAPVLPVELSPGGTYYAAGLCEGAKSYPAAFVEEVFRLLPAVFGDNFNGLSPATGLNSRRARDVITGSI